MKLLTSMTGLTMLLAAQGLSMLTTRGIEAAEARPQAAGPEKRPFALTVGRGAPVCESYLALLNKTKFEHDGVPITPFCGRPEDGPVDGFEHLERRYLTAAEIFELSAAVQEFMWFDDQNHSIGYVEFRAPSEVQSSLLSESMRVWSYARLIDIANDRTPRKILIWQGYGALGGAGICGFPGGDPHPIWNGPYVQQRAFVLAVDGKSIDEKLTRAIFGAYDSHQSTEAGTSGILARRHNQHLPADAKPFQPLSDSIGIFGFEGRYYVQTENMPASKNARLPPVEVFLHQEGRTKQVCAFRPDQVPKAY